MNTADYLLLQGTDNSIAVITDSASYTYGDLRDKCARVVGELLRIAVQPGDKVGICGGNSLYWIAAYLAILKLGAVAVPIATTATPDDIRSMIAFAGCIAVCADRRSRRLLAAAVSTMQTIILDEVLEHPGLSAWPHAAEDSLDADAALMFTSGTTASPRAVRVTHRNIQANTNSICEYLELTDRERIGVVLPFYYCYGLSLLHTHLRVGGSVALINSFVYPELALDLLERTQCTGFAAVPSVFQTLLRDSTFSQRKFEYLRKVQQAGGKLQDILIRELIAALPDAQIYIMYGQTEATARLSYLPPSLLNDKLGSVGRGIPGVTLRVLNDAGNDVLPGDIGEICAWGENVCPGYFNDPEATAEKFSNGALHSGDLATVDKDGFIYIVDRKSDFIKSFGHRVSSQQIESCVLELPDVVAAAAIGEPDLVSGESIKVFVTLRSGSPLQASDIIAFCAQRLARHMVPSDVVILDRLPLNAHGKVVKSALRKHAFETQVNRATDNDAGALVVTE